MTLIELLVVVAIIAILAALLLPAIAKSKQKALNLTCLGHLKQLQAAWHLYAQENADAVPPNNYTYDLATGAPAPGTTGNDSWCLGNTRLDTTTSNIEKSVFFSYTRSAKIYHCPSDQSTVETSSGAKLSQLRTRSYSMSQSVNGKPTLSYIPTSKKFCHILDPKPTKLLVFLDVHEEQILDSLFGIPTVQPGYFPQDSWWDLPADRHAQGCNFSFADGHVEHWRWAAPKVYRSSPQAVAPGGTNEWRDYWRVQESIRQKIR